jgi:predicted MFS family arabinose efflux permease
MGYLADRFGPARVLAAGGLLYAGGLWLMSTATSPLHATVGIGLLTGFAMSMTGFPIVLSVIGRRYPPAKRSLYLGIASAGGSSGQLFLVPFGQWLIDGYGWVEAMLVLAAIAALVVPLSAALAGGHRQFGEAQFMQDFGAAMREAGRHGGYRLLVVGYFVCGFQTLFIGTHLPAYLVDLGQDPWLGATALAVIGGFNVIGCIFWGQLGGRRSKKNLLALLYLLRALVMAAFMLVPLSEPGVMLFAAAMGLLWLATVPLTTGVVVQIFGTQYMATLVGFTFVSHQVGSFLGIWLGGVVFDATGSYTPIFWGGVVLGFVAALVHYPIDERTLVRPSTAPAVAEG